MIHRRSMLWGIVTALGIGGWHSPAIADLPPILFYGFIQPSIIVSSSAVESFSQANLSAPTAAANPIVANQAKLPVASFQVAQSRLGVRVGDDHLAGRLEFDFIDFSKSTPTTQAIPRLRRALIDWKPHSAVTLLLGQDWDLISPLAPFTFNWVGHSFEAGDIGFMRLQAQVLVRTGVFEHGLSIGFPAANSSAAAQALEHSLIPTVALRESLKGSWGVVGLSGLIAAPREASGGVGRFVAGAVTVFGAVGSEKSTEFRAEGYFGRNTASIGLLGLAYSDGNAALGGNEAGGYLSVKQHFKERHAVFAGISGAWLTDPSAATPSYVVTAGKAALSGKGPGIEANQSVRAGYQWKAATWVSVFTEVSAFWTRHHLDAADVSNHDSQRVAALGAVGTQFDF